MQEANELASRLFVGWLELASLVANWLCDDRRMTSDYTPGEEATRLYARHKRFHEGALELRDRVKEQAAKDLLNGATPAQLAKLTGLSDEFFRRIARSVGAERKRPPTVGREVEAKRAQAKEAQDG